MNSFTSSQVEQGLQKLYFHLLCHLILWHCGQVFSILNFKVMIFLNIMLAQINLKATSSIALYPFLHHQPFSFLPKAIFGIFNIQCSLVLESLKKLPCLASVLTGYFCWNYKPNLKYLACPVFLCLKDIIVLSFGFYGFPWRDQL